MDYIFLYQRSINTLFQFFYGKRTYEENPTNHHEAMGHTYHRTLATLRIVFLIFASL